MKPVLRHIGESDRIDALQLLCPNCHSKAHHFKTRESVWGDKETIVVRKRKGRKRKPKKEPRKKRRRSS